VADDMYSL